jgi:hypothetical protein
MVAKLSPAETRAQDSVFVTHCSLKGLQDRLPLRWPAPADILPSPKTHYRSHYVYLGWDDLQDPTTWEHLSDFDLLLRLIDFSPLRPVLAQRLGWTSALGWQPFDPVSMFLVVGWQIVNGWSRAALLRQLHHPRYADYVRRFGFEDGRLPTEGGLRHWLTALGHHSQNGDTIVVDKAQEIEVAVEFLNQLLVQSVGLFRDIGLISPEAWNQALICPDGMLHDAASRLRCSAVCETCYQPAPRPCPAKEKGHRGCDCDTLACASSCRRASPRDPEARFIWYERSNQSADPDPNAESDPDHSQQHTQHGEAHYGYASLPLMLADPARRFHLILLEHVSPANTRLENPFAAQLLQLSTCYPSLHISDVAADAAFGYDIVLRIVHKILRARRVIDLRAHETDKDKPFWPVRGYDARGRPVCQFGFSFTANGFDPQRLRYKWLCEHVCLTGADPLVRLEDTIYPPHECPHLEHPYGRILNVGECFDDGSIRLVRDVPFGSAAWKRLYQRPRNAAESRNALLEAWGLKRLPVYGAPRAKALLFLADVWANLTSLARLIREATAATGVTT